MTLPFASEYNWVSAASVCCTIDDILPYSFENLLNKLCLQSRETPPGSVFPVVALMTSSVGVTTHQLTAKLGAFPGFLLSGFLIPLKNGALSLYGFGISLIAVSRPNTARNKCSA